jgi:molecular chaperone Hsp33
MEEAHDELVRTLSADRSVSVRVLVATNLVREAARRHHTAPTASVALGRALMGSLLLASEAQDGEHVQLQIRGDGPLGTVTVTANSDGEVRGYAARPTTDLRLGDGQLDVPGAVGMGSIAVERNHRAWKQPYAGIVPIVSGEIAQDLARYLLESEQKPSAVALGVYLGAAGDVQAAGGYMVQGLPGASEACLARVEASVAELFDLSVRLRAGASASSIVEALLTGVGHGDQTLIEPRFRCPCSIRRVLRAATLLGRDEVREIVQSGEDLEVRCEFCGDVYRLNPDSLGALFPDA